ncbi:MAG: MarR family transcriptional regulator [Acidobacteria bacterium]|nr:MarR family transcriptional regulator [Acidobacteriota bacterium]
MPVTRKSKNGSLDWAKLADLAEFRYQLRRFVSFSEAASEAAGISAQQYQLLQVVATVPGGQECSISYIAERMVLRHNTAVELVDRAEKAGLVQRVADANDHRRSLVETTPRGNELLAQLVPVHLAEVRTENGELLRSLQQLIGNRTSLPKQGVQR